MRGRDENRNVDEVGWSLILLSTSHQSILAAVPRSLCVPTSATVKKTFS